VYLCDIRRVLFHRDTAGFDQLSLLLPEPNPTTLDFFLPRLSLDCGRLSEETHHTSVPFSRVIKSVFPRPFFFRCTRSCSQAGFRDHDAPNSTISTYPSTFFVTNSADVVFNMPVLSLFLPTNLRQCWSLFFTLTRGHGRFVGTYRSSSARKLLILDRAHFFSSY